MTSSNELLHRFLKGGQFNFGGTQIPGQLLSEVLENLSKTSSPPKAVCIQNAVIDGQIVLDEIGQFGHPLTLAILHSKSSGPLRARSSVWRQLVISESAFEAIDMPRAKTQTDFGFEGVSCNWIELRGIDVVKGISVSGATLSGVGRDAALELSDARIGDELRATNLQARGAVVGERMHVVGDVLFDGAHIDKSVKGYALNLEKASIGGDLRICQSADRPFRSRGSVVVLGASLGGLLCRGGDFDGKGNPSLVADMARIREAIDLGGSDHRLFARGTMRFLRTHVGQQVQIFGASFDGCGSQALTFDGCRVDGDFLIGQPDAKVEVTGLVSINGGHVGGNLIVTSTDLNGLPNSLLADATRITGKLAFYESKFRGAARITDGRFNSISIQNLAVARTAEHPTLDHFPRDYAHADDALLDISFARVENDVHAEALSIDDGDFRFIHGNVQGTFSISNFSIGGSRASLVGQSAEFGGLHLAGTRSKAATLRGEVNLMGAKIRGDLTVVDCDLQPGNGPSGIIARGSHIEGNATISRTIVCGELNFSGSSVAQDFSLEACTLEPNGRLACDMRGVAVRGRLTLVDVEMRDDRLCKLRPEFCADGAELGLLAWNGLKLARNAILNVSNAHIRTELRAERLTGQTGNVVDLSGTTIAELRDALDDQDDGWGAGRVALRLDGLRYDRLTFPSGRTDETASIVHYWRAVWLRRRIDERSTRAIRMLATVLRNQGLFEAARLSLMDAFAIEGRASRRRGGAMLSWLWGATFGYGLSGRRAFLTVVLFWMLGVSGTAYLQAMDLLVDANSHSCGTKIDPYIFAADAMLPVLDLGEERLCSVGMGPNATPIYVASVFEDRELPWWTICRLMLAIYEVLGWLTVSLAIATWSGIFKRSGRE